MSFRSESLQARGPGQVTGPGEVDYRLVRKHTLDEFRRGRLSKLDVCDAHPELLRAARNVGEARSEDCPICDDASLTLVSFAFGARLPAHGRCITTKKEMAQLRRSTQESTCYVVEVCTACAWNQLVRSFRLGSNRPGSST
ncbi:MAG TPA: DUF5318 family protein [Acidimicrobiales bacterium]|nr:DUF5318 family protein [Acidimicrobiales bacterium]HWI03321.1 DUF5318 family protein [Acidimicrobiales bacterium]